jgi:hypothetical protein
VEAGSRSAGWLLAPIASSDRVGVRVAEGWSDALELRASWYATATGYVLVARLALESWADEIALDVLVNETAPGRARRRGQLVLSGAHGSFVYLRGDRHERERLIRFAQRPG